MGSDVLHWCIHRMCGRGHRCGYRDSYLTEILTCQNLYPSSLLVWPFHSSCYILRLFKLLLKLIKSITVILIISLVLVGTTWSWWVLVIYRYQKFSTWNPKFWGVRYLTYFWQTIPAAEYQAQSSKHLYVCRCVISSICSLDNNCKVKVNIGIYQELILWKFTMHTL